MDERTWRNWWKKLPCLLLYCLFFSIYFISLPHDPHFFIFSFILLLCSSSSIYFYYTSDIFNSLHLFIVQLKWDFLWIFEVIHICIKSKWICTLTYYLQFPLLISSTQEGILSTIDEDAFKTIVRYLQILCKVSLNSPCMTICQTNSFSEFPLWNLLIGIHGSLGKSTMRTVIQPQPFPLRKWQWPWVFLFLQPLDTIVSLFSQLTTKLWYSPVLSSQWKRQGSGKWRVIQNKFSQLWVDKGPRWR